MTLAVEGDETQTGFSFTIARGLDQLAWEPIADEAVDRAVQMLGAAKPATAKVPVILDPFAASNFLGVLAGALNADNVLKGRSLFADMVGQEVGAPAVHAASTTDAEPTGRARVRSTVRACRAGGPSCSPPAC